VQFEVDPEKCSKCGICFRRCPAEAVIWKKKETASLDKGKCIQCMTCITNCPSDAIY
jgi:NADH-quinone oxidoreductase subunit F/NAD(P)H dehydrogenase (quinone)/NADP-reducing hydrogenase subunit HndC